MQIRFIVIEYQKNQSLMFVFQKNPLIVSLTWVLEVYN
jgi:hypothetical protein